MNEDPQQQDRQPLDHLQDRWECDLRKRIKKTLEKANSLLADCGKSENSSSCTQNQPPKTTTDPSTD